MRSGAAGSGLGAQTHVSKSKVVEQHLKLARKILTQRDRPMLRLPLSLEQGSPQNLRDGIVVAFELVGIGELEIEHEATVGGEVTSDSLEKTFYVSPIVQMLKHTGGRDHQGERAAEPAAAKISRKDLETSGNGGRLEPYFGAELGQ